MAILFPDVEEININTVSASLSCSDSRNFFKEYELRFRLIRQYSLWGPCVEPVSMHGAEDKDPFKNSDYSAHRDTYDIFRRGDKLFWLCSNS